MENYTLEELNEFLETEEYQQLDELSKKTLGSYIKKATQDVDDNSYTAGSVHADTSGRGNKTYDTTTKQAEKRKAGISKAVDKLVKESVAFDDLFYQIEKGELVDAKSTVTEIIADKVFDTLETIKKTLSGSLVNEGSYEDAKAFLHPKLNKWVVTYKVKRSGKYQQRIHDSEDSAKEMASSISKLTTKTHKRADSTGGYSAKKESFEELEDLNEAKCTDENGDEEAAEAVAKLPKPKKAKPEVDGDGNVIEKWKPFKEELDESIVASKNDKANKAIDDIYAKAKANTKTVNVKDLFKKKSKE